MVKKSETPTTLPIYKTLNVEDKGLIAELSKKSLRYVYMVLNGDRNNDLIIHLANILIDKKKKLKRSLVSEVNKEEGIKTSLK